MAGFNIFFDATAKFNTIHFRHHHIRDNQIDVFHLNHFNSFSSVSCRIDDVVRTQKLHHQIQ